MADVAEKIVRLKIEICDIDPPIWRRVDVPANFSLRRLHDVIQAVFDWQDYHLHQFEIGDRHYGATEYDEGDLEGRRLYSDRSVRLGALLDRGVQEFLYRYDFGDDWEHLIRIEQLVDPEAGVGYPVLADGSRRAPPEDCGGAHRFDAFLEAVLRPDHEDHKELTEWYGRPFDPDDMELDALEIKLRRIRGDRRKGRPRRASRASL